jgi:fluoride exporter
MLHDSPHSALAVQAAAIAVGAVLGAWGRWALGLWLNAPGTALPWGTLAANWVGAVLIGLAIGVLQARPELSPLWRLALITGFLGALTTFSTQNSR